MSKPGRNRVQTMTDKDEILAAIATLGTNLNANIDRLDAKVTGLAATVDVIANGVGRLESEVAVVKTDIGGLRIDLAAHRMQSNARITTLEEGGLERKRPVG